MCTNLSGQVYNPNTALQNTAAEHQYESEQKNGPFLHPEEIEFCAQQEDNENACLYRQAKAQAQSICLNGQIFLTSIQLKLLQCVVASVSSLRPSSCIPTVKIIVYLSNTLFTSFPACLRSPLLSILHTRGQALSI